MKKYLLLLILLLIPFGVLAAPVATFPDEEYTIEVNVDLQGKELEEGEFTFELRNYKGEVVDTATNNKDGKVVFKPRKDTFEITNNRTFSTYVYNTYTGTSTNENGGYAPLSNSVFYTVNMVDNKNKHYKLDTETVYVSVGAGYNEKSNYPIVVNYLKNIESLNKKPPKSTNQVYHATEEELWGEAYGVFDPETKIMTYFRDEAGKYTNEEIIDGKQYFTNIEESARIYNVKALIEKVIIKDALKPVGYGLQYLFQGNYNLEVIEGLEKIDTTAVSYLDYTFSDDYKLKELDLSTWDTSNVQGFYNMCFRCYALEKVDVSTWNTSNSTRFHYMFGYTMNLKSINLDNFDFTKADDLQYMFQYSGIESLDLSKAKLPDDREGIYGIKIDYMTASAPNLRYVNIPYDNKIGWSYYYDNPCLSVIYGIQDRDKYPYVGPHTDSTGRERDERYFYSYFDQYGAYWFFPKSHTVMESGAFRDYMNLGYIADRSDWNNIQLIEDVDYDIDPSFIVRPMCNSTPSTFTVLYSKEEIKEEVKGEEEVTNPKTGVFTYTSLIMILLMISLYIHHKYKCKTLYKYNQDS